MQVVVGDQLRDQGTPDCPLKVHRMSHWLSLAPAMSVPLLL
jgi:hypothetical protein